jgi:hypothetical protein
MSVKSVGYFGMASARLHIDVPLFIYVRRHCAASVGKGWLVPDMFASQPSISLYGRWPAADSSVSQPSVSAHMGWPIYYIIEYLAVTAGKTFVLQRCSWNLKRSRLRC